jgi:replication fork clamp-binding protein CrfC
MNSLISLINKLQEILTVSQLKYKINLPQIICIGSQSSGKSSIIESIIGKDFLPKGSGIITRRPIILQLINQKEGEDYCEFFLKPNEKITDFSKVTKEIILQTEKIAGKEKLISDKPIIMKIYSTKLIDLTLVDLPGLVKVPLKGQPENIDNQIKKIVLDFISNSNSIILAITPSNIDISNSDSLKIAREVDPYFTRTLGVISKVDLVENYKEFVNIIKNNVYPLKYGYIGVTCRTSKENLNNKSLDNQIQDEEDIYKEIDDYNDILNNLGIKNLTIKLKDLLTEKIKLSIPTIKENLNNIIFKKQKELKELGDEIILEDNEISMNTFLLSSVFKFTSKYKEFLNGDIINSNLNKTYIGAAKISKIFNQKFINEILSIDPLENLKDEEILIVIKNTNGLRPSLFVPEVAFEILVKQQIKKLEEPGLLCIKKVYDELINTINSISLPEIIRFKKLDTKIKELLIGIIDKCIPEVNEMIKNLIKIELAYINSSHPDFLNNKDELNKNEDNNNNIDKNYRNNLNFNERELMEISIVKNLIVSYFNIVKKNYCDFVPKTIMCFLVNKTKDISEQEIIAQLYKTKEDIKSLLKEDEDISQRRKELKDSLIFLKNSFNILNIESNK